MKWVNFFFWLLLALWFIGGQLGITVPLHEVFLGVLAGIIALNQLS